MYAYSLAALLHVGLWESSSWGARPMAELQIGEVAEPAWNGGPQRVTAPYAKPLSTPGDHPSTAGHVKSCRNLGGPPSKAKHSLATDSEPVP